MVQQYAWLRMFDLYQVEVVHLHRSGRVFLISCCLLPPSKSLNGLINYDKWAISLTTNLNQLSNWNKGGFHRMWNMFTTFFRSTIEQKAKKVSEILLGVMPCLHWTLLPRFSHLCRLFLLQIRHKVCNNQRVVWSNRNCQIRVLDVHVGFTGRSL